MEPKPRRAETGRRTAGRSAAPAEPAVAEARDDLEFCSPANCAWKWLPAQTPATKFRNTSMAFSVACERRLLRNRKTVRLLWSGNAAIRGRSSDRLECWNQPAKPARSAAAEFGWSAQVGDSARATVSVSPQGNGTRR